MAAARTVISALWPIDDKAAAEFMGQLFSARNEDLPHVMQRIALSRISALRNQGKPDNPFFWAGFVATGDWKAHGVIATTCGRCASSASSVKIMRVARPQES